ncbi:sensor histidine kinase [Fodinibius sp. SL11]|uniref:sensor histidine kinase n=1 Tax=Fodinibius sp. SL11 TaxID=3425690 RepID=UPI003F881BD2
MSDQSQMLPNGIAIIVNDDGIIQKIIHDSYGLYATQPDETQSFVDSLDSDSVAKGYQFIARINANDVAYDWELHVSNNDETSLFNFSGIRFKNETLIIGTSNPDDTEQFLNGLMEMNNESVNQLRTFMKQQQQSPAETKDDEWAMYDQMSGLNNELANMQRKLTKKTAELERMNKLKNKMLGMAAHDLRNPLTIIQNYALFLIEDHEENKIFTDDQFELVKEIKESSEYMVQIIEDMLDISAIESGSISLEKKDEDIGKLIERTVSLNRPTATKKDISIITSLPDLPINKEVDAHKFQQVLDNLISNSIKYSQLGSEITVGIEVQNESSAITIFVKDEGQGIPKDELEDLFVPFAKISSKPTAGEKSTGLGLAIAKKIVEAHDGEIEVESEVGEGTTFFVNIP